MNPVAAGVTRLAGDYQWSSYRSYIGVAPTPQWLQTKFLLNRVGRRQRRKFYRFFVEKGVDDETQTFYDKKKFPAVMGSNDFRESIHSRLPANTEIPAIKTLRAAPSIAEIIQAVSMIFATPEKEMLQTVRGCGMKNSARSAAIYCCRKMAGLPLNEIAKEFGFNHYGSVSGSIARFDRQINEEAHLAKLMCKVENIINKQT